MAAGDDLIGPKQSPRGKTLGLDVRAGDGYHGASGSGASAIPFGPVVQAWDPVLLVIRYFRYGIIIEDNGDGTTTPITVAEELDSEGNIIDV